MKLILRTFVYSYISLYVTQIVIGGFVLGGNYNVTLFLLLLAVTLLNVFLSPILSLLGLPKKGPSALFMSFIMNLIVFYMLTVLIPSFSVHATTLSELLFFGFVLPSKSLTKTWSLVLSSLLFVLLLQFFRWLGASKTSK